MLITAISLVRFIANIAYSHNILCCLETQRFSPRALSCQPCHVSCLVFREGAVMQRHLACCRLFPSLLPPQAIKTLVAIPPCDHSSQTTPLTYCVLRCSDPRCAPLPCFPRAANNATNFQPLLRALRNKLKSLHPTPKKPCYNRRGDSVVLRSLCTSLAACPHM